MDPRVDQLLGQLSTSASLTERAALDLLTHALEDSGAVAMQSPEGDRRFDISVWSDDLDAIAANPLLIEVKRRLSPHAVELGISVGKSQGTCGVARFP